MFQDLLREGVVDILRPDLHTQGITRIRQIAALAETYYVAVAPNHDGGPVATAAALHLAASLPNFFIQHIPWPADERDRRMRSELVSQPIETVRGWFRRAARQAPGLALRSTKARSRSTRRRPHEEAAFSWTERWRGGALARRTRGGLVWMLAVCASGSTAPEDAAWQASLPA